MIVIFRGYLLPDPNTVGHGPFRLQLANLKRKGAPDWQRRERYDQ
ncbi:hypothetical protein [Methylobacterium nodulans]|nr:hypothetical protein [Methylobacterium nodulans]